MFRNTKGQGVSGGVKDRLKLIPRADQARQEEPHSLFAGGGEEDTDQARNGGGVIRPDQRARIHGIKGQLQVVSEVRPQGLGLLRPFGGQSGVLRATANCQIEESHI